jgi:hypothetical protein
LNLRESNEIFRRAIVRSFFEVELMNMDYHRSSVKHPLINEEGLTLEDNLHLYFDLITGNDYPDGDEWFGVEYLFPHNIKLPDQLVGPEYFTTIYVAGTKHYWRHRELIRYKYGKSKKLSESLDFINRKYRALSKSLYDSSVLDKINK